MIYRLCIKSSCLDPETKGSLNSMLAKGPNCLADQITILLWVQSYPVMLVGDISKAWNAMRTTEVEKNLWRMVWRFGKEGAWQTFVVNRVMFGNKLVTTLFKICVEKNKEQFGNIDCKAAHRIKCNRYVDDLITRARQSKW